MNDNFWTGIAADLRRARKLHPLESDEIAAELRSTAAHDLTEERIAEIVAFATSDESLASVRHAGGDVSVARFIQELSAADLVPAEKFFSVVGKQQSVVRWQTPLDLASELVQQNLLPPHDPEQVGQELKKGVLFGDYLILDPIGRGGMGVVFRAVHLRMERIVALKLVSSTTSPAHNDMERFEREIKALAKLIHPNIVTAFDAGKAGGVPYLVMEHIDGSDLASLVSRIGPLTPQLATDYALQAARGLAYAHKQQIIHRDVKPGNMLVDGDGVVKISDLGLAKYATLNDRGEPDLDATAPGTAMGTYSYMSPEQASGADIDSRTDIYGLGCTLFFLLSGRPPAEGSTDESKAKWHREAVVPSLRVQLPEVPERLDAIFQRMLAKAPADRPQSMTEVVEELEACQNVLHTYSVAAADRPTEIELPRTRPGQPVPGSGPEKRNPGKNRFWLILTTLQAARRQVLPAAVGPAGRKTFGSGPTRPTAVGTISR